MVEGRKWRTILAALGSALAPVVALGFALMCSGHQTWTMTTILRTAVIATILVGFILGIISLLGSLHQDLMGSTCLAGAALGLNGIVLLCLAAIFFAAVHARTTGYTIKEMQAMPRVIPGSHAILHRHLGYRIEFPHDFVKNQHPQPPQVLDSFLHTDARGVDLCVTVEGLGGRLDKDILGPESDAGPHSRVPPNVRLEQAIVSWKTHQLDAFRMESPVGGNLPCAWAVEVPLAREAIQITVSGRRGESDKCRQVLVQLLTGLEGISNWDPPSVGTASRFSVRPGPRASQAAEPTPPADPSAEPIVVPGPSQIRVSPE